MSTDKAITRPSARMDRRRTEGDHHYQAPKGWMLCGAVGKHVQHHGKEQKHK